MASIKKRNDTYLITISSGKDINGKRIRQYFTYIPKAKTEKARLKETQEYADDLEKKINKGEYFSGEDISLNDFYLQWKENYAPNQLTTSKIEQYSAIMESRFLKQLGHCKIDSINAIQLQKIVTDMIRKENLKPQTIKSYITVLSSVLTKAYNLGVIKENPCKRLELPKIRKDPSDYHTFSETQAKAFLRALDKEYIIDHTSQKNALRDAGKTPHVADYEHITIGTVWKAYFTLALFSGCRRGELLALTWNDLDFERCTISINKATASTRKGQIIKDPKTRSGFRTFMLPVSVFTRLAEWEEEQMKHAKELHNQWQGYPLNDFDRNYVFTQAEGQMMHLSSPTHKFKEILKLYNDSVIREEDKLPDIVLHDLRHCMASLLIANGLDVATVSARLGHANISVTLNTYTHALKRLDETASEKLGMILDIDDDKPVNELPA